MAGTKEGGKHAAETNRRIHGEDFYARIGAMGGRKGKTGGFFSSRCNCDYAPDEHKTAECAGYKGGVKSRRTKATV